MRVRGINKSVPRIFYGAYTITANFKKKVLYTKEVLAYLLPDVKKYDVRSGWIGRGAFDSAKNHKRQSVTAKREKSQTSKFL